MFKRHPTSKMAMIAYLIWWILIMLSAFGDSMDRHFELFVGFTFVIVLVYFILLVVKITKNEGVNKKDFSIMLILVLLPVLLPILSFLIYLLCGGRIISKLW